MIPSRHLIRIVTKIRAEKTLSSIQTCFQWKQAHSYTHWAAEVKYRSQEQKDTISFLTVQNAAGFGNLSVPFSITPLYAFSVFHHFKAECQQLQCETQKSTNMGIQRHGLCILCKLLFS